MTEERTQKIHDFSPILVCNDVSSSLAFYVDKLGFELINFDQSLGRSGFASIRLGKLQFMLTSASYYAPPKRTGSDPLTDTIYYFYTDDIGALRDRFIAKDIECGEFAIRFYRMKEFEVQDPDGRILIFGQETDEPPTPEH